MTREAITTHMDDPVEPGLYLISTESGEIVYSTFHAESFDDGSMWLDSFGDGVPWDDFAEYYADSGETFYIQSLADHDSEVAADATVKALELTDKEADVAAEALEDADDESWYYDSKQQVIRDVLKAVASFRKEQKQ